MKPNRPKTALISVWDKTGLPELARALTEMGWKIISTGGTARFLKKEGLPVTLLSDFTGSGELLDGRVKSLHPAVYAGILALRNNPKHIAQLEEAGIGMIDLVAVNLYPFEKKARSEKELPPILEAIDIGGVALLRAGAKNFEQVVVLSDPDDYREVVGQMRRRGGVCRKTRRQLAGKAFQLTAACDTVISSFLEAKEGEAFPPILKLIFGRAAKLRYGENPQQGAAFYRAVKAIGGSSLATARQLQGKELSYNNILDLESALSLVLELEGKAAVIIKHNNPCGVAESNDLRESYRRARRTDSLSAFGSVLAFNRRVGEGVAEEVTSTFVEAVIAPGYTPPALRKFSRKKNLRILEIKPWEKRKNSLALRSVYGGLLLQEEDVLTWRKEKLKVVTKRKPTTAEWGTLAFAWKVCKHTRSNAIVLARGRTTVGIGAGQMSRIDAARLAVTKAHAAGMEIKGAVLASDAFFPFRDVVDLAAREGVTVLIQPGGSLRDRESIQAADGHGLAMVFTGIRHFKH